MKQKQLLTNLKVCLYFFNPHLLNTLVVAPPIYLCLPDKVTDKHETQTTTRKKQTDLVILSCLYVLG